MNADERSGRHGGLVAEVVVARERRGLLKTTSVLYAATAHIRVGWNEQLDPFAVVIRGPAGCGRWKGRIDDFCEAAGPHPVCCCCRRVPHDEACARPIQRLWTLQEKRVPARIVAHESDLHAICGRTQ